jgi:hypothetical protein
VVALLASCDWKQKWVIRIRIDPFSGRPTAYWQ